MPFISAIPATNVLAVSIAEAVQFGCPHCGSIFGNSPVSGGGSQVWQCADCNKTSLYVAEGLKQSTIGVGNEYPKVSPHPRRGCPVDREKLIADREKQIEANALVDLQRWVLLGHGQPARLEKVGSHRSKSNELPIIGSECSSNTRVTWFGYNYYFYFLGVKLWKPIPATLLYPISSIFGSYPLSGHVNTEIAPPITNFQKLYHNCTAVQEFGGAGGHGLQIALALRYLEEVSKLDSNAILDVCLHKSRYGKTDLIDGNGVESDDLMKLLGIEGAGLYDKEITNVPSDIFEKVVIDKFGTSYGGKSAVQVIMQKGMVLPPLPLPAEVSLDPARTALKGVIPGVVKRIPIQWLAHVEDRSEERRQFYQSVKYQPHGLYQKADLGIREFVFHTPNILDSALTAFFLMKVLAPVLRTMQEG